MSSNVITMAQIAKPNINDVFKSFLEEESKRLAPKTFRKYKEALDLLGSHLNSYGSEPLLTAEKAFFDKHYNAEGDAHRDFCDIFGPEKIFETIGSFFSYFMIRKVMAGEELKRTTGTVVKKLSKWLVEKNLISEESAASAEEEGSEASTFLPIAEKASRILGEHAYSKGLYPNDFEDDDDYIEFDHLTITKLEPGKLWLEYHDIGEDKVLGPISVPASATKLLKPGWDISCGLGRTRGKWQIIEMGNVYPG